MKYTSFAHFKGRAKGSTNNNPGIHIYGRFDLFASSLSLTAIEALLSIIRFAFFATFNFTESTTASTFPWTCCTKQRAKRAYEGKEFGSHGCMRNAFRVRKTFQHIRHRKGNFSILSYSAGCTAQAKTMAVMKGVPLSGRGPGSACTE